VVVLDNETFRPAGLKEVPLAFTEDLPKTLIRLPGFEIRICGNTVAFYMVHPKDPYEYRFVVRDMTWDQKRMIG
jgi:hypothetical protein